MNADAGHAMPILDKQTPGADGYASLIGSFPLRPIRSDAELDRAVAMIDSLIDRGTLDAGEQDYLDVLSDLVEKYESTQHPLPAVTEAAMLRHLIEAREITQAHLAAETEIAESTISAILSGHRGMRTDHVAALARYFHVSPAVFIAT